MALKSVQKIFSLLLTIFYLSLPGNDSFAQDRENIIDYSENFILRLYTLSKFNALVIENPDLNEKLILEPNGVTSIGLGFNYKN